MTRNDKSSLEFTQKCRLSRASGNQKYSEKHHITGLLYIVIDAKSSGTNVPKQNDKLISHKNRHWKLLKTAEPSLCLAQNDTYRSAGDATTGTVLEIAFMYSMLLPAVCLSGLVFHWPIWAVFLCCYIDEPIRFVIMQKHMYSGKWIRPVTPQGKAALPAFMAELSSSRRR